MNLLSDIMVRLLAVSGFASKILRRIAVCRARDPTIEVMDVRAFILVSIAFSLTQLI